MGENRNAVWIYGKDMFELFKIPTLDDAASAGKTMRFSQNPKLSESKGSALAETMEVAQHYYYYYYYYGLTGDIVFNGEI